jgi:exonuclease VII small subunit
MDKEQILDEIHLATAPNQMSKKEAKLFLEELVTDLEADIEALETEIDEEDA